MRIRRLAVAGIAIVALTGLSACGPKNDSPDTAASAAAATTTAPAAPKDPSAELAAAAVALAENPAKIKMEMMGGITMTGAVDAKNMKGELTADMGQAGTMITRQVGVDTYVKTDGQLASAIGGQPGKWMHIDTSKLPAQSALNVKNQDPAAMARVLTSSTEVTKTGDHAFSGKLDLTKSPTINQQAVQTLGAKLKAVPFTAETDEQGRLVELVMDMESVAPGAGKMTAAYSDFGTPVNVAAPPAADVVEMPAKFLKAMGGA
jgi:hypothetical protein